MIRMGAELPIECLGCPFLNERGLEDREEDGVPDPCDEKECFVATAAFGTERAGKIDVLRAFLVSRLLTNASGRRFVDLYLVL
jgi:hypothetical protein